MGPIRIRDQSYIKQKNIESILGVLEECQPISRAEISRITDMSPASITRIVNALLALGLVSEGSIAPASGRGRRAINLRIRPNGMYTLGISLEAHRIRLGVLDFANRLVASQETEPASPPASPQEAAEIARSLLDTIAPNPMREWPSLRAVGVSVPGTVDNESGRVSRSDQLGWTDVAIVEPFAQAFGLPAWAENDVKACLVGERVVRSIPDDEDAAYLLIGAGLGLAMTAGGYLLRGAGNAAGEIHGVPFGDGVLRDYLVTHKLLQRARENNPTIQTMNDVLAAYDDGEAWAVALMSDVIAAMRVTLYIVDAIAKPHHIMLGGPLVSAIAPLLREKLPGVRMWIGQNYVDACVTGAAIVAQRQTRRKIIANELDA